MVKKGLLTSKGAKFFGGVVLASVILVVAGKFIGETVYGKAKSKEIKIFRKTSIRSIDPTEMKKFNINLHTLEPLGIEVLPGAIVELAIGGKNIEGEGEIYIHNTNNVKPIKKIQVGKANTITIKEKGQLLLDVNNIKYSVDKEVPFNFVVKINFENENYIETPTFDVRKEKISKSVIKDGEKFVEEVIKKENADNGILMISENVRMYFPQAKYVPKRFNPEKVLQLHEDTVREDNILAGLDENASNVMNKPRKNFILVSARNEQAGYMSAGGQMLDTHPTNTKEYFYPGWGMYHEYGHLYEQGWSYIEVWNNMFSKHMTEQTIGFTWLWGTNRKSFERATILPLYENYKSNNINKKDFEFKDGLYFFTTLEEVFGKEFVGNLETYWREHTNLPSKIDFVAYAVADIYGVNLIPYIELYGLEINSSEVYDKVIEMSSSSFMYVPEQDAFAEYKNLSVPATVKGIYEGENVLLSGIANKGSGIKLVVDGTEYSTTADEKGRFAFVITKPITINSRVSLISIDPQKEPSLTSEIKVKNALSDNKFHLQGYADGVKLSLGFDPSKKELVVKSSGDEIHYYFSDTYFSVEFYGKNGELKKSESAIGTGNANAIKMVFDKMPFEYGDYIKISHKESDRAKIYGNIMNSPQDFSKGCSSINLSKSYFYITEEGVEYSNELK